MRAAMESRLGHDFGKVRVHAGAGAADAARALGAKAFAARNDIVFGAGQYAPTTPRGQWLLAHELAHVAQQDSGDGASGDVESDARSAATAVMRGRRAALGARHDGRDVHRFGEPENVPEMTYISTQGTPGFLQQAVDFHTGWGLPVQRVNSIEQMVDHLAGATTPLARIRFVTHAAEIGVFTSLFTGEPLLSLQGDRVSAYAQSDAAGLALDTQMNMTVSLTPILTEIRRANAAVLQPFGLDTSGVPSGALDQLFQRLIQLSALTGARTAGNAAQFDPFLNALPVVLADLAGQVVRQFAPAASATAGTGGAAPPTVTLAHVTALRAAITVAITSAGMTFTGISIPAQRAAQVREALRAVNAGFRGTLNTARGRFGSDSWVDIRGCNAGDDIAYLQAVSRFFGTAPNLPHVSAPTWFQVFPTLGLRGLANEAAINGVAGDANVTEAINRWSPLTGARQQMELLRSFYSFEVFRRTERAERPVSGSGSSLFNPPPRLTPPMAMNPLVTDRPTTAEDRTAVSLLTLGMPPRLELTPPSLLAPRDRFAGLLGDFHLPDPGTRIAQSALDRLNRPNAELHYYLNSALVLPVFRGGDPQNFHMFVSTPLQDEAIDHWLGSQWSSAAPGLAALRSGPANAAPTRRVQALVENRVPQRGDQMVFPPDPQFWQHINQI